MRRYRKLGAGALLGAGLLLAGAQPGLSQDAEVETTLTGVWAVSIDSPEGVFEMTWELEQHEDGTVTGTSMADMIGEFPIDTGWVDGDAFGLSMYVEAQGEAFDIVYEGTFSEDEVVGSLDVGGGMFLADFSGVRVEGGVR